MKFLIGYILWTMLFSIYETLCLRMAWGRPWIHGPALAFQFGAFVYALWLYHRYRSNASIEPLSKKEPDLQQ